jgi:hypothetical protein
MIKGKQACETSTDSHLAQTDRLICQIAGKLVRSRGIYLGWGLLKDHRIFSRRGIQ